MCAQENNSCFHASSLLAEGGQPMTQRGPVDEGVVVTIRLWADLRAPPRQLGDYGAGADVSLPIVVWLTL